MIIKVIFYYDKSALFWDMQNSVCQANSLICNPILHIVLTVICSNILKPFQWCIFKLLWSEIPVLIFHTFEYIVGCHISTCTTSNHSKCFWLSEYKKVIGVVLLNLNVVWGKFPTKICTNPVFSIDFHDFTKCVCKVIFQWYDLSFDFSSRTSFVQL